MCDVCLFCEIQFIPYISQAVLWSGAFIYHSRPFCSLSLTRPATLHPFLRTRDTATLVKNPIQNGGKLYRDYLGH